MGKRRLLGLGLGAGLVGYLVYRSGQPRERRDRWARRLMNERIAPVLVRAGVASGSHAQMGIVEHVGRVTGTVRHTVVHPIPLGEGRFALPLAYGEGGEWPKNVLAAGACRLEFRDCVYGLTNPRARDGHDIPAMPPAEIRIGKAFGGRFLELDVESVTPGQLEPVVGRA